MSSVYNIIDLEVNQESDLEKHFHKSYSDEDSYLSDAELDDCLITKYYCDGEWIAISSQEYLNRKRDLIPAENNFMDLRDTAIYCFPKDNSVIDDFFDTSIYEKTCG